MGTVATFFLRAKHWQIFLLLFGIGCVGGTAAMLLDLVTVRSPEEFLKISLPFGFVMVLFMFCLLAWLWSMGSFLSSVVHPALRLRMGFFRFALAYPAIYLPIFIVLFQSVATRPAFFAIIFPFHFFSVFCLLYDLHFVSKNLVLAETGKPAAFPDYAGPFFLVWFFPVGVWFIQPKINRLCGQPRR